MDNGGIIQFLCLRRFNFSCYKHTSEYPLYKIEKRPKLNRKQGMYSVVSMDGRILKRGHNLLSVLSVLENKLLKANNKK